MASPHPVCPDVIHGCTCQVVFVTEEYTEPSGPVYVLCGWRGSVRDPATGRVVEKLHPFETGDGLDPLPDEVLDRNMQAAYAAAVQWCMDTAVVQGARSTPEAS